MNKLLIIIIAEILFLVISAKCADTFTDSDMTFSQAIEGTKAPKNVVDSLCLVNVEYYSSDGKLHRGQLVVNIAVRDDIIAIFELIKSQKFPVNKCIPIVKYGWLDDTSMSDNNTSGFCYRFVAGTDRLSNHALGRAIDINPFFNPVIYADDKISPTGAKRDTSRNGTFTEDNEIVKEFKKRGWRWGGNFESFKDYHHFDKK